MKRHRAASGFALIVTLVLLSFILLIVVSYLVTTRTDRSTSSVYANRLRAKMMADSGLAAATKLLYDNTKNGNYVTAMPAPSPSPAPLRTEIYRPDAAGSPDDYLKVDNAIGEILASRTEAANSPAPAAQIDPRPPSLVMPAPAPGGVFGIGDPALSMGDSYDFNQIVRIGSVDAGRLVEPAAQPAFGQWVRVRNNANELVGRYAFFVEDESMKINVNSAGNNLAAGGNLRTSDTVLPEPAPAAPSQVQEIDPSAILEATANRRDAMNTLVSQGNVGDRLPSKSTIALLADWSTHFGDYAHTLTTRSRDDDTTARGWQRLDLNGLVGGAVLPSAKAAAARQISDWIRDAWTGTIALDALQEHQIFGNERLRQQFAANIVDYIDSDNIPVDLGDVVPPGYTEPIPILGIEKIPYLGGIAVIYEASGRPPSGTTTTMKMKLRFTFVNLFESELNLEQNLSRIDVKGIPVILKDGQVVFDKYDQVYSVPIASLHAIIGNGDEIPPGLDGTPNSGARTFETDWLVGGETVTFPLSGGRPNFESGDVNVQAFGVAASGSPPRLDVTSAPTTDTPNTHYARTSNGNPTGDFLEDSDTAPRTIAAIYVLEKVTGSVTQDFGDPRYRPALLNERWRRVNQTDNEALSDRVDLINSNPRVYAIDWNDYAGNRPLAFIRNGPLLSVGELGNVATGEYPWRTLYLQYPERPSNSSNPASSAAVEVTIRRSTAVDSIILDLFRTTTTAISGRFNINSQLRFGTEQNAVASLFLGVPVGAQTLAQNQVNRLAFASQSTTISPVLDRRIAAGPPVDNNERRPFFQNGELASVLSRLVNTSRTGSGTVGSPGRTTVDYSALRNSPTSTSELNPNIQRDTQIEQAFRKVSNAITTRGNVFRILYVGQAVRDVARGGVANGIVDGPEEVFAEYLGEAFVERVARMTPDGLNPNIIRTSDSEYRIVSNRVITE